MNEQYTCYLCKKQLSVTKTMEEQEIELQRNFPGYSRDQCVPVCSHCWNNWVASLKENSDGIVQEAPSKNA